MRQSALALSTVSIAVFLTGPVNTGFTQDTLANDAAMGSGGINSKTLWVTNDGADTVSCGLRVRPCRSISQAMENASDGDSIGVGAGHYGNVSGDINFSGPGDEHPDASYSSSPGLPPGCIICIRKALHIQSIHGAAVTVIDGSPSTPFRSNVMILHDGVIFGSKNHGFTITGGNEIGVSVALRLNREASTHNVTIAGNVDVKDGVGFMFDGEYLTAQQEGGCPEGECSRPAQILLSDNQAIDNKTGFNLTANTDGGPVIVRNNLAFGADTGFATNPGSPHPNEGGVGNRGVRLVSNVAAHCSTGFSLFEAGDIQGNTASGNTLGFMVVPGGVAFRNNSAIGNAGPGVIVNVSAIGDSVELSAGGFSKFSQNNFFGNDRNRPVLNLGIFDGALNTGPSAHCGVLNVGALAAIAGPEAVTPPPVITIQAAGNFWGSIKGPSANGPGDAASGPCDQNGGVTIAKPFALSDFAITS
jgi:hypothetical protein